MVLTTICLGCSGQKKADPLLGTYVGWMFIDGQASAADGSLGMSQKLTLRPEGVYTLQTESSAMMTLSARAEGVYTRGSDNVTLSGTQVSTMDDGYKKETTKSPHNLKLKLEDGMLVMKDGKGDPFYFRKEGKGPPPVPHQLQLKHSDVAAIALIDRVQKAYASLKSLQVTGFLESKGAGFVAEKARFKILFQRPSKFRFEGWIIGGGTESDRAEITWDGSPKCWWYSSESGESTDRTLGNALSITAVNFGPEANLVPSLLLPNEFGGGGLSTDFPEATYLPNEKVGGKVFAVLQLRSKGADITKLWVDESSGMIVRFREELRGITITFDPHPNAAIDVKDFRLGKRSGSVIG